jgi:hypothetical protein
VRNLQVADIKSTARWLGVIFSGVSVIFAILTYAGFWNEWRGDNLAAAAATRFDKSYSQDASRAVKNGDKEWLPLMRLITKYSCADLPKDREPRVIARFVAVASAKDASGAEWTAPTTPIALLYKEWPGHGDLSTADWRTVGTIEDLHNWIRTDEADFDFLVRTIIFGILSFCVGVFLALPDRPRTSPQSIDASPGSDVATVSQADVRSAS